MISTVIPVYKNTKLFLKNLKHNYPFLDSTQIIIVNDNPIDQLDQQVIKIAPKSIIINNLQNYGFAKSMNLGVKKARGEYLLFLNSDVRLQNNRFAKAVEMFKDQSLFALTFAQIEKDGHLTGANRGRFYQGLFHHQERQSQEISENLWPEGGSSLIRKKYFDELGGFNEIYSPFYWEDVDLGYRAKQKGWKTLFYPLIKVEHHHQSTINKYYSAKDIKVIAFRNQFLFVWRNMPPLRLCQHWLWLPILLLKNRQNQEFKDGLKAAWQIWFKKHEV